MELYTDAELAPYGEGHPTARAVEKREYVVPFGAKESEEIDEEIKAAGTRGGTVRQDAQRG
jgi:predicted lactoylglutathione lyase